MRIMGENKMKSLEFKKELEQLINKYSVENGSDTPDFILANYLMNCLQSYEIAIDSREKWYGRSIRMYDEGYKNIEDCKWNKSEESGIKEEIVSNLSITSPDVDPYLEGADLATNKQPKHNPYDVNKDVHKFYNFEMGYETHKLINQIIDLKQLNKLNI